jgi:integrase
VTLDLRELMADWEIHLQAERKAAGTRVVYLLGVRKYAAWCEDNGVAEPISRTPVKAWLADLFDEGLKATTVTNRLVAVKRFSAWLSEEGITGDDPLAALKRPRLDDIPVEPLTAEEIARMIAACSVKGLRGDDGAMFRARRDEALIRLLASTGMRAGELVAMTVGDTDLRGGRLLIRRAKGGKTRELYISPLTAEAVTRYLRLRKTHRLASTDRLWLGWPGKGFAYPALRKALRGRAEAAGIKGWHPHRHRHTFSDAWLERGGSESGLMANNGWTDPGMLRRYTAHRRQQRAIEEAKRLGLGDL